MITLHLQCMFSPALNLPKTCFQPDLRQVCEEIADKSPNSNTILCKCCTTSSVVPVVPTVLRRFHVSWSGVAVYFFEGRVLSLNHVSFTSADVLVVNCSAKVDISDGFWPATFESADDSSLWRIPGVNSSWVSMTFDSTTAVIDFCCTPTM